MPIPAFVCHSCRLLAYNIKLFPLTMGDQPRLSHLTRMLPINFSATLIQLISESHVRGRSSGRCREREVFPDDERLLPRQRFRLLRASRLPHAQLQSRARDRFQFGSPLTFEFRQSLFVFLFPTSLVWR